MLISADERPTILAVDDAPANLTLINELLKGPYRIKLANSGPKALQLASAAPPDLILLDIMMPGMDGFEVCRRLKADPRTCGIPVLFLTAKNKVEDETTGLGLGAVDFIHKPFSPPIVTARVKTHLQIKAWQEYLADKNEWLERQVELRLSEINHLQDASIFVMVSLAEFRDECTGNHLRRTQEYVRLLAQDLARHPRHQALLTPRYIEWAAKSATLHDVGKIAIPDPILLKPGKLTAEEYEVMKTHARRGHDILQRAGEHMGERGGFLALAKEIALSHHERWDGNGYPNGLAGEAIPLSARLMALADVFDALLTRRAYKAAMSVAEATKIIVAGRGTQFAPDVVDSFLVVLPKCEEIAMRWSDE
jgi:putative two-component system response regulator